MKVTITRGTHNRFVIERFATAFELMRPFQHKNSFRLPDDAFPPPPISENTACIPSWSPPPSRPKTLDTIVPPPVFSHRITFIRYLPTESIHRSHSTHINIFHTKNTKPTIRMLSLHLHQVWYDVHR